MNKFWGCVIIIIGEDDMKKRQKIIVISVLFVVICLMAVAYMALSARLQINAKGNVSSKWGIEITSIKTGNVVGGAKNTINPSFTATTATFNCELTGFGDSIEYIINITNTGNIDASLSGLVLDYEENSNIKFTSSGFYVGDIVKAGESKNLIVKASYIDSGNSNDITANLTVNLEYKQAVSSEVVPTTISGKAYYNNNPCEKCLITIYEECKAVYEATTDEEGNYTITNVMPGTYSLYATKNTYGTMQVITASSPSLTTDLYVTEGVTAPICTS